MITAQDFNDGMAAMRGAFNCSYADVEVPYWDTVRGWSPDMWRHAVKQLMNTHKYSKFPTVAQLEDARRGYNPPQDTGASDWIPIGTPMGMLKPVAMARIFACIQQKYEDVNVKFVVVRNDMVFERDWNALMDRHGMERSSTSFSPADCCCDWCRTHNKGFHHDLPQGRFKSYKLQQDCKCDHCAPNAGGRG